MSDPAGGEQRARRAVQPIFTAHHEAGHFVLAYRRRPNAKRYYVSIAPNDKTRGVTVTESSPIESVNDAGTYLVEALAGWVAATILSPDLACELIVGATGDLRRAAPHIDTRSFDVERVVEVTHGYVSRYWPQIRLLATALLNHQTLDFEAAEAICDAAQGLPARCSRHESERFAREHAWIAKSMLNLLKSERKRPASLLDPWQSHSPH